MRSLFKYRLADTYLVICIIVALFMVFYGVDAYNAILNSEEDIAKVAYKYSYQMYIEEDGDSEVVEDYLQEISKISKSNVVAKDIHKYIDNQKTTRLVDVVICEGDNPKYIFLEKPKDKKYLTSPGVFVGIGTKNSMSDSDNSIVVDGYGYSIAAVLGSARSGVGQYGMIFFYESLPEATRKKLLNNSFYRLIISSDSEEIYEDIKKIQEIIEKTEGVKADAVVACEEGVIEDSKEAEDKLVIQILYYVFAILNTLIAVELWIYVRRQQIIISKLYGMNNIKILYRLFLELVKLSVVAAIVCVLISTGIGIMGGEVLRINTIVEMLMLIGAIPVTALIILITLIKRVNSRKPYEYLVESEVL